MQELARAISERRIRLKDGFQDYDRLHTGIITDSQFIRVITAARLAEVLPSVATLEAIADEFSVPNSNPKKVRYADFLRVIEDPATRDAGSSPAKSAARSLVDTDEAVLAKATDAFAQTMKNTGLDPRGAFRDFDKTNCGKVTATQFARSFPFRTEPRVIKLLTAKYGTADGALVRYGDWVNDLRVAFTAFVNSMAAPNTAAVNGPASPASLTATLTAEDVLSDLAHNIAATRTRVDHLFTDGDPAHTGRIATPRFESVMGALRLSRFQLSAEALQLIVQRYAVPEYGAVNYRKFVAEVEALADADMSSTMARTLATAGAKQLILTNRLSEEETKRLEVVLGKLRLDLRTRCATLKPTFKDFDRAAKGTYTTGTCTRSRFERCLAVNGVRLTQAEVDLLEKVYSSATGDGFAYPAFCNDVEAPAVVVPSPTNVAAAKLAAASSSSSATTTTVAAVPVDPSQAISDIAAVTRRRGIRLTNFLRDFDALRGGKIPSDKFLSALAIAGVSAGFSFETLDALVAKYANTDGTVNYIPFLNDVEEAIKQRVTTPFNSTRGGGGSDANINSNEGLSALIDRLRLWVRNRGVLLPPFFHDYDVHHNGRVTRSQFLQLLKRHNFPLSTQEAETIAAAYIDPAMNTHVAYRPFITRIDDSENLEVTKAAAAISSPLSPSAKSALLASSSKTQSETDVQGLVRRIATAVQRGARAQEFIRDADPLRHSVCHKSRLVSGVAALGVHLTAAEAELLMSYYASSTVVDHVDYPKLLRDVDAILDVAADSANPAGAGLTLSASASSVPLFNAKTAALLSDLFLSKLVSRVQSQANARRLSLAVVFQDHDPLRKGKVTESQFFSALATLSIKFSPVETKALLAVISLGSNEVAYVPFCKAVEQVSASS